MTSPATIPASERPPGGDPADQALTVLEATLRLLEDVIAVQDVRPVLRDRWAAEVVRLRSLASRISEVAA